MINMIRTLYAILSVAIICGTYAIVQTVNERDIADMKAVKPVPRLHDAEWSKLYADANRIMPPRYQVQVN